MIQEDQLFIADVVNTNPTWEMVASSVISWLEGVMAELSAIVKIHKYRGLHEKALFYSDGHGHAQHT